MSWLKYSTSWLGSTLDYWCSCQATKDRMRFFACYLYRKVGYTRAVAICECSIKGHWSPDLWLQKSRCGRTFWQLHPHSRNPETVLQFLNWIQEENGRRTGTLPPLALPDGRKTTSIAPPGTKPPGKAKPMYLRAFTPRIDSTYMV